VRVAKSDVDSDGAAEVMDAAYEPFDAAAIDHTATELRHPRLPNAEVWCDDMLALRTAE
jgi:hypothetical protein